MSDGAYLFPTLFKGVILVVGTWIRCGANDTTEISKYYIRAFSQAAWCYIFTGPPLATTYINKSSLDFLTFNCAKKF